MRRREFIGLLGGAAAWPITVRAQQPRLPVVGFLRSTSLADSAYLLTAFRQGLEDAGFVEGQNIAIEVRSAEGQTDRLPSLVADLIRRPVAVIAGNSIAMAAAKAITTTTPIVFAGGGDPVAMGFVPNLNRPGGNVTGVFFFAGVLASKRLELLRQLAPRATTIGLLVNPHSLETEAERREVQAEAQAIGQPLISIDVNSDQDIEAAFTTLVRHGAGALLVGAGPFMTSKRQRLIALAARHELPATYGLREFAADGGLMSYGTSISEAFHQAGIYVARILKGEEPGEIPIIQSSKVELIINLKTAKTLRLEVPPSLLARADEVIE
jgi:putative ABC transport system substrate-binding protein